MANVSRVGVMPTMPQGNQSGAAGLNSFMQGMMDVAKMAIAMESQNKADAKAVQDGLFKRQMYEDTLKRQAAQDAMALEKHNALMDKTEQANADRAAVKTIMEQGSGLFRDNYTGVGTTQQYDNPDLSRESMQRMMFDVGAVTGKPEYIAKAAGMNPKPLDSTVADIQSFNHFTTGMSPEDIERAKRIKMGLDPRAVTDPYENTIKKLLAEKELKPTIAADVKKAELGATNELSAEQAKINNQKVWNTYNAAMSKVTESLGGTSTGPVAGLLPAITSGQLKAEGATSAMLPVLKQIFRESGEGVFTDKDQEMLANMMPTRKDTVESAAFKVQMIDSIVRAKLGIGDEMQTNANTPDLSQLPKGSYDNGDGTFTTPEGKRFKWVAD